MGAEKPAASSALGGLIALGLIGFVLWSCLPSPATYEYRIDGDRAFGCLDLADLERLVLLSAQGDDLAYRHHGSLLITKGRCTWFPRAEEMVVESYSGFREMYLARRKGDSTSYWFVKQFIAKKKLPTSR